MGKATQWILGILAVSAGMAMTLAPGSASAQTFRAGPEVTVDGGDGPIFAAGGEVTVTGDITGGVAGRALFAAGGEVTVDAYVAGGIMATGGDVSIGGAAENVTASGGEVRFTGRVDESAQLAGGTVDIDQGSFVGGDLRAAGGEVFMGGEGGAGVSLAGGEVEFDGRVAGDLNIAAENVVIGPNAVIEGDLNYRSPNRARIADGASIRGETVYRETSASELRRYRTEGEGWSGGGVADRAFGALFWFVASAASGALMGMLFPGWIGGVARAGRDAPIGTALGGLALLILIPILAVLLMLIIIGLPFGLFLLAVYGGLLVISSIGAGYAFGHLLFDRSNDDEAKLSLFLAGLAIILVLGAAPFIGWIVTFLAAAFGLGALTLSLMRSLRNREAA